MDIEKGFGEEFELKIVSSFSERLNEALARRGFTQADLSRATKISTSIVTRYAKGKAKPKIDRLRMIAEKLNVNEGWLEGYNVPIDRAQMVNSFYKPDAKMTDVDKVLGYGLVRQVYEAVKDLDDVQIKKVLTFIDMIK